MMYMDDAVKATIDIMKADAASVKVRSSYNLAAFSITPREVFSAIKKLFPDFTISYSPDFRQAIADSWPHSIDDSAARTDWGWQHRFNLEEMTVAMFDGIRGE